MNKLEQNYNKIGLIEFIVKDKKHLAGVIVQYIFALVFFFGALTSDDLGWGQPVIMVLSILWGSLAILQKWLILKKLRKNQNK